MHNRLCFYFTPIFILSLLVSAAGANTNRKIVGGQKVETLSEAPFMVSLSENCGGSIISAKWILTAAHCVGHFSEVKAGVINLYDQGITFNIKRVIRHPAYNRSTLSNDVALVELTRKIKFKKYKLSPIKLADPKFEQAGGMSPGIMAMVFGFGDLSYGRSNDSMDLNKVEIPIVSNEVANHPLAYNGDVDETMMAAGLKGGGKDACQGDSGGPLVIYDQDKKPVQVGIVSWGEGCASPYKYGIYSKVSKAFEWIRQVTGI